MTGTRGGPCARGDLELTIDQAGEASDLGGDYRGRGVDEGELDVVTRPTEKRFWSFDVRCVAFLCRIDGRRRGLAGADRKAELDNLSNVH